MTKPVVLIGQAQRPETRGAPFQKSNLWKWFTRIGWAQDDVLKIVHFDALVDHGSVNGKKGKVPPTRAAISLYRPQLLATITKMQPRLIVPVGGLALQHIMSAPMALEEAVGQRFVARPFSPALPETVIIPLPHPSGVSLWLNSAHNRMLLEDALGLLQAELQLFA